MAAVAFTLGVITSMLFVIVSSSSEQCHNGLVARSTLTSNSTLAWTYNASLARMSSPPSRSWCSASSRKGWFPGQPDPPFDPYLQVDMHSPHVVTGVSIKGLEMLPNDFVFVTGYQIQYKESVNGSWKKVMDPVTGQPKKFIGNNQANPLTPVYQAFPYPIDITILRFVNLEGNTQGVWDLRCMRVEVWGCTAESDDCADYAVATNKQRLSVDACEGLCGRQYGMNYQLASISSSKDERCIYRVSQQGKQPVWTSIRIHAEPPNQLFDFITNQEVPFYGSYIATAEQRELTFYRLSMRNGGVTALARQPIDPRNAVPMPVYVQYTYYFATPDSSPAWNFDEPINCACHRKVPLSLSEKR